MLIKRNPLDVPKTIEGAKVNGKSLSKLLDKGFPYHEDDENMILEKTDVKAKSYVNYFQRHKRRNARRHAKSKKLAKHLDKETY